jgi:peptide/nickel transport system ATP-binding protein
MSTESIPSLEPAIQVKRLSVSYWLGDKILLPACRDVQFDMGQGESIGLLGESGAGKSTVAYALMGLIEPPNKVTGEIACWGKDILTMDQAQLRDFRWNEVAMVFQAAMNSLDPVVTVGKNIDELLLDKGVTKTKGEAKRIALDLLRSMDLSDDVYKLYPFELSGGMKQRVIIAMALATHPKMLILDEPTTALDTITQFSVLSAIRELKREGLIGGTMLISHDVSVHAFMVDRILVFLKGILVEDAPMKDIVEAPKHPYAQVLNGHLKLPPGKHHSAATGTAGSANECPFVDTCPYAMPKCSESIPPLITVTKGHRVACYLYGE